MSGETFEVQLSGERAGRWREVVGRDRFPIQSPVPILAILPGFREPQECYLLDPSRLTPDELDRIARYVSTLQGGSPEEVRREILERGLPIRAVGTSVAIPLRVLL